MAQIHVHTDEELESMSREELMAAILKNLKDPDFKWWEDKADV